MQVVVVVGGDRKLESALGRTDRTVVVVSELQMDDQRPSKADVFVVDARGREHLPSWLQALAHDMPAAGLIVLGTRVDPALMLEAMRAGVREYLAEPLTSEELEAAIARVSSGRQPVGSVFAFVGAKGGVGTTTAAVNVALELASAEPRRTLLVDLHLSNGDAAVFLAAEPRFTVRDAIENAHRLDEAFLRSLVVRTKAQLDLLASPDSGMGGTADAARIRSVVEFAARHYRFTVLDVPRSEAVALDALQSTECIVIVANQELATVRSAARLAATLRQRYGKDRIALSIARYDPRSEIGQDDIERVVGVKVRWVLPSDYRRAVEALNSGKPISMGNHNRLSASFKALAADLAGLPSARDSAESSPGLFARMMGRRSS